MSNKFVKYIKEATEYTMYLMHLYVGIYYIVIKFGYNARCH